MQALSKLRRNIADGLKSLSWNSGNWVDSDLPGNIYASPVPMRKTWIPGQHFNYAAMVGPLIANSAYMACLGAFIDAFTASPATAMVEGPDSKLVPDRKHPLTELLTNLGHDDYDASTLWDCTIADYLGHGNAYWMPVYDRLGNPLELRYVPYYALQPIFPNIPTPGGPPILYYEYTIGTMRERVPVDQVINFQWGAAPENPHLGIGRGDQLVREIFQDNTAGEYAAAMLKNMGILGRIITPKDVESAKGFNEQVVVDVMAEQSRGEKRGSDVAFNRPFDIYEPQNSPEKMALDKIRQYPESRICAVCRVPAMVVGLQVGHAQKTYSNYPEARDAFWEDSLLPMQTRMASQATKQLLRRSLNYRKGVWMGFDTTGVKALQEDQHKVKATAIALYDSGLWDAARALQEIGDEPKPEDEGRMSQASTPQLTEGQVLRTVNTAKSLLLEEDDERVTDWAARIEGEIAAIEEKGKAEKNGHGVHV